MWDLRPQHCIAARQLLGWDRAKLARESGVSIQTVGRFERGDADARYRSIKALEKTLTANGIVFEAGKPRGQSRICEDGTLVRLVKSAGASDT